MCAVGDELIYLDPHTTQQYVDLSCPDQNDVSYHCQFPSRLDITQLDPSVALVSLFVLPHHHSYHRFLS